MFNDDVKNICLNMYNRMQSFRNVAELTGKVSKSTIHNWVNFNNVKKSKCCPKTNSSIVEYVRSLLEQHNFLTIKEIAETINSNMNIRISESSVRTCIKKAGFTYKKSRYVVSKEGLDTKRTDFAKMVTSTIHPDEVISIDESSVSFEMTAAYGWQKKGQRLNANVTSMKSQRWSMLLAVTSDGEHESNLIEGSIDSRHFASFVETLGALRKDKNKKYLLLDNASIHKTNPVLAACETVGLIPLYLPPYTPFFQPVEHCFSVIKHRMTKMPPLVNHNIGRIPKMMDVSKRIHQCLVDGVRRDVLRATFEKCWKRMGIWNCKSAM